MAISKIESGFPETLETDYTKWFTPSSDSTVGVIVNSMNIREITKDIFFITMNVRANVPAKTDVVIGTLNLNYFNNFPMAGTLLGAWQDGGFTPAVWQITQIRFSANGNVSLYNLSDRVQANTNYHTANGLVVRREV